MVAADITAPLNGVDAVDITGAATSSIIGA